MTKKNDGIVWCQVHDLFSKVVKVAQSKEKQTKKIIMNILLYMYYDIICIINRVI